MVNEAILAAVLRGDEPEALRIVEPLHGARRAHCPTPVMLCSRSQCMRPTAGRGDSLTRDPARTLARRLNENGPPPHSEGHRARRSERASRAGDVKLRTTLDNVKRLRDFGRLRSVARDRPGMTRRATRFDGRFPATGYP